jgi:ATP-dependent DNA helicase DinG
VIDEVRAILGPGGPLSRALPGYEDRPEQLRMAEAVARAIERETTLLVEAGTGTGKTLAYLVPAILSGKKVVVSTGTRALQDQIVDKDLPLLAATTGLTVRAAAMKGLTNYVCRRRLDEALGEARAGASRELLAIARWARGSELGDRAELGDVADDHAAWGLTTSSSETRIGAKCARFAECFVTDMRARAQIAQIVIVNHHLYFADLATRSAFSRGVLPDHDAVIFDEAHRIEDVATEFFGVRVGNHRVEALLHDVRRSLMAERHLDPWGRGDAQALLDGVAARAADFFRALPDAGKPPFGDFDASPGSATTSLTREMIAAPMVTGAWHALDDALDALAAHLRRVGAGSEPLGQAARRAMEIRESLATILDVRGGATVRYVERRARSVALTAAPIDLSELLREKLFFRTGAVVLTSATLATAGDFAFLRQRLGVDFDVEEMVLGSPFDWMRQAALYTPPHLPDPRDPGYLEAAAREIEALVALTGGGAFILCTSLRMMRALHAALVGRLDVPCLLQGERPKGVLLDRFRALGHAVLFATASFWEGIDVPGDALRLVVIDKLPFEVPSDPVVAARIAHLEENGQDAFSAYQVPSAAISLKQGFGRLVRTRTDRGIVAILDRRLTARGYGKDLLRSLPQCARVATLEEAREFWQQGPAAATL